MHDKSAFPPGLAHQSSYPGQFGPRNTNLRPLPPLPPHLNSAYHSPASHRPQSEPSAPSGAHTILNPVLGSHPPAPQAGPSSLPGSRAGTPYGESKPVTPVEENGKGVIKRGRTTEREDGGSRGGTPGGNASGGVSTTPTGEGELNGNDKPTKNNSKKVKVGARASIACIACR